MAKPIYLLADSQVLFWRDKGSLFLKSIPIKTTVNIPRAAYIGASNGDLPEHYAIFQAAMEGIKIRNCKMIHSIPSAEEIAFLVNADVILLAGGDPVAGWRILSDNGIRDILIRRYSEEATLIGISAGAIQLGLYGVVEAAGGSCKLVEMSQLVPFVIDAHDEARDWQRLQAVVELLGTSTGIGIPRGGALVYHPDGAIEAIKAPVTEISTMNGRLAVSMLINKPNEAPRS